jgi:hypothetical protein
MKSAIASPDGSRIGRLAWRASLGLPLGLLLVVATSLVNIHKRPLPASRVEHTSRHAPAA